MYSFNKVGFQLCARNGYEWNEKMYIIMERLLNLFMERYEYDGLPEEFDHL